MNLKTSGGTDMGESAATESPGSGEIAGTGSDSRLTLVWVAAFLALILLAPVIFFGDTYGRYVGVTFFVNATLAVSFQLLFGYAKLISFGHAALMAIGGYGAAIGTVKLGLPMVVAWIGALLATGVFAALMGWIVLRLSELFLAVVTLAFGLALVVLFKQIHYIGGEEGMFIDPLVIGSIDQALTDYYFGALVFLATFFVAVRLSKFRFGREILTVGNDPVVAQSTGMSVTRTRVQVFVVSSLMAAAAGILYVHTSGLAAPTVFGLDRSILILAMVVVGGLGSMPGAVLGAALLTAVPEVFASLEEYNTLIYGSLLLVILMVSPGGLVGLLDAPRRLVSKFWNSRRAAPPAPAEGA
jgi:branched-chain amino acid transport system permease protein